MILRELLQMDRATGHMAIHDAGVQVKFAVIRALAKHLLRKNVALAGEIQTFCRKAQNFCDFRNEIVHDMWVHYPRGTTELALLKLDTFDRRINPFPDTETIKQLAPKIEDLKALQAAALKITDSLKALRGKFV